MNVSQSMTALAAALIHPTTGGDLERARYKTFMLRTLSIVFVALAMAPFFLAFHGAPAPAETLLFVLSLVPLGAVMLVSTTGRIALAHGSCAACLIAIGAVLALSGEANMSCAVAWLVAAQSESLLSLERRLVVGTGLVAVFAFTGLVAATVLGFTPPATSSVGGELFTGLALALAVVNTIGMLDLRLRSRETEAIRRDWTDAIADAVGDLVVRHDRDGSVDYVGRDCERHLGIPTRDLLGRGLFEHIHVADRPVFLKAIADAAHDAETVTTTVRLRAIGPEPRRGGIDATFLWIEMRARRLTRTEADGGVITLLRNVTASRRFETDLEIALQTVETARLSRDHFLANMSHELRTPLNAIIGFSEMLGNPELRPRDAAKQTEYARIINQSGQHLLAVVNSILDMSKIQSGTFSIIPESFDVAPLIDSCCDIVTLKAQEDAIEIVRAYADRSDTVVGDRRACKQILINLLSNAVKFTGRNGRVTIATRPEGTSLLISVTDTGIGIGASDLARLGDPFFQAKSALDRPYEGTGLGLSVVRGLVGLHGGTITIESEPGRGTSVIVRLPLDCRYGTSHKSTAKIETFARRQPIDRLPFPPHDMMVKKSA